MRRARKNLFYVFVTTSLLVCLEIYENFFRFDQVFSSTQGLLHFMEVKTFRKVSFARQPLNINEADLGTIWKNRQRFKHEVLKTKPDFRSYDASFEECIKRCKIKLLGQQLNTLSSHHDHKLWEEDQWMRFQGLFNMFYSGEKRCFCLPRIPMEYIYRPSILAFERDACLNSSHFNVYLMVKCTVMQEESDFLESLIGCFPTFVYASETLYAAPSRMPPNKCLLVCESEGFLLAISIRMEECYCFSPTVRSGYPDFDDVANNSVCNSKSQKHMFVMRTYVEDTRCPPKKLMSSSRDLVALISFPGSGNTWTRHLLESASGYYTGSVYLDQTLYRKGFLGEALSARTSRTLVIKNHYSPDVGSYRYAILIVRNPFDTFVAHYNLRNGGGHTGTARPGSFQKKDWLKWASDQCERWSDTILTVANSGKPTHFVFYEDLVTDPIAEVRKMLEFTRVQIQDLEQRLLCTQGDLTGNFQRSKPKLKQNRYPPELVETIKKAIIDTINALPSNSQIQRGLRRYL